MNHKLDSIATWRPINKEKRTFGVVLASVATLYALWFFLYRIFSIELANPPLLLIILQVGFVFFWLWSRRAFSHRQRENISRSFSDSIYVALGVWCTLYQFAMLYTSQLHIQEVIFFIAVYFATTLFIFSLRHLVVYGVYVLSGSLLLITIVKEPVYNPSVFFFIVLSASFLSLLALTRRLSLIERIEWAEHRIGHILSHLPLSIFHFDNSGQLSLLQGSHWGLVPSALPQTPSSPSLDLKRIEQFIPEVQQSFNQALQGKAYRSELTYRGRFLRCWSLPVEDQKHKIEGVLFIVVDDSEKRRQQLIIEEQKSKLILSSRLATMGELASGIAHEIKNPLTVLYGRSHQLDQLLSESAIDQEAIKDISKSIEETTQRIADIVQGVRNLAAGKASETKERISVDELFALSTEICGPRLKDPKVHFVCENHAPEDLVLLGSPIQLAQVLNNLLSNALDATEKLERQEIHLKAWLEPVASVKFQGSTTESPNLVIDVSDNGPGVPENLAQQIMEPFFTTKKPGAGTGLGLSISRTILENHGGRLSYVIRESRPTFEIKIDMKKNLMATSSPASAARSDLLRKSSTPLHPEPNNSDS